jgi:hypothetical protein
MKKQGKPRKVDGLPVRDADTPLEVHVRMKHIRKGKPDPCACAFALALMEEHNAERARVHCSRVFVEHNGEYLRYRTPPGMTDQLELFDKTGKMGPGVYTITVVPPSLRLGADRPRESSKRGSSHGPARLFMRERPKYARDDQ